MKTIIEKKVFNQCHVERKTPGARVSDPGKKPKQGKQDPIGSTIAKSPINGSRHENLSSSTCNLRSSKVSVKVQPENSKPGRDANLDRAKYLGDDTLDGSHKITAILPSPSQTVNNGNAMEEKKFPISGSKQSYLRIPRSLLDDERVCGLRLKYRKVLDTIIKHLCWSETSHYVGVNKIPVMPGQFCVSYRELVDLCNEGVRFKDDKVDKNIVERAVSVLTLLQLVRHEVRHGKMLITSTIEGLYEIKNNESETQSETKPRHNRDTKEGMVNISLGKDNNEYIQPPPPPKVNVTVARENPIPNPGGGGLENSSDLIMKHVAGGQVTASISEIYSFFLRHPEFENETIKQAIREARDSSALVRNIMAYLKGICERIVRDASDPKPKSRKPAREKKEYNSGNIPKNDKPLVPFKF